MPPEPTAPMPEPSLCELLSQMGPDSRRILSAILRALDPWERLDHAQRRAQLLGLAEALERAAGRPGQAESAPEEAGRLSRLAQALRACTQCWGWERRRGAIAAVNERRRDPAQGPQ